MLLLEVCHAEEGKRGICFGGGDLPKVLRFSMDINPAVRWNLLKMVCCIEKATGTTGDGAV
jgi:hypothetical protein